MMHARLAHTLASGAGSNKSLVKCAKCHCAQRPATSAREGCRIRRAEMSRSAPVSTAPRTLGCSTRRAPCEQSVCCQTSGKSAQKSYKIGPSRRRKSLGALCALRGAAEGKSSRSQRLSRVSPACSACLSSSSSQEKNGRKKAEAVSALSATEPMMPSGHSELRKLRTSIQCLKPNSSIPRPLTGPRAKSEASAKRLPDAFSNNSGGTSCEAAEAKASRGRRRQFDGAAKPPPSKGTQAAP
mmetsp:Transcript_146541/g.470107  ORF Transcript_146541/g.470107 Transcript_146541/m.470107 type:complete len:241 (-) Transcript_146541:1311-2033(-)